MAAKGKKKIHIFARGYLAFDAFAFIWQTTLRMTLLNKSDTSEEKWFSSNMS